MKEILVARKEFAVPLASSAVAQSVTIVGVPDSSISPNACRSRASAQQWWC
ncbi:hypothetical protein [Streptomyces sp. NPDC013455]|uniref:hypothetical protein n=1 Tax=Streptomyces sp. NPDC013455 TaxID=3155605 RepID=UPI0033C6F491